MKSALLITRQREAAGHVKGGRGGRGSRVGCDGFYAGRVGWDGRDGTGQVKYVAKESSEN